MFLFAALTYISFSVLALCFCHWSIKIDGKIKVLEFHDEDRCRETKYLREEITRLRKETNQRGF